MVIKARFVRTRLSRLLTRSSSGHLRVLCFVQPPFGSTIRLKFAPRNMQGEQDTEHNGEYKLQEMAEGEQHALLPLNTSDIEDQHQSRTRRECFSRSTNPRYSAIQLTAAFVGGILACALGQVAFNSCCSFSSRGDGAVHAAAPTHVGNTEIHNFPPVSPTNAFPSLFPTDVGFAGPTFTGAEPGVVKTAPSYPTQTGAPVLIEPTVKEGTKDSEGKKFDTFKYWGNLSPWYSIERGAFGVDSGPDPPQGCAVTGLHFLHRHGARYPTQWCMFASPIIMLIGCKTHLTSSIICRAGKAGEAITRRGSIMECFRRAIVLE